jgi:hypothetical protein
MSDIVERLRAWVYTDAQYANAREAADEIERLRNLRDEDGVVMSKLIDGYQKILRLLIDGPESMETDIVSDAREWLDRYAGRESTHSAKCHGWHDACLIARLVSEIERLRVNATLTDGERKAVNAVTNNYKRLCDEYGPADEDEEILATLQTFLERTK